MSETRKQPLKLLLIDDNPEALALVQDALAKENLEILTAWRDGFSG
jgi:response regulator RpfG family c-di-GMP phosphodiesterase